MMHRAMEQLRKLKKDEQRGLLSDFAGAVIEAERAAMENVQNEPVSDEQDVSEATGSSATDRPPMRADGDEQIGLEVTHEPSKDYLLGRFRRLAAMRSIAGWGIWT